MKKKIILLLACYCVFDLYASTDNLVKKIDTINSGNQNSSNESKSFDVTSALADAYQNNQEFQEKLKDVLASHENIIRARQGLLPSANVTASVSKGNTRNFGNQKDSGNASSNSDALRRSASVTVSQNLFNGGANMSDYITTDFSIRASWENLKSFEQSLFLQTIQYFLEIYFKKKELNVHKANIEALEYNYKAAVAKMQSGEETATQVALAEGKLADAQARMGNALAELEVAKSSYLKITCIQVGENLQTPKIPDGIPKNLQELLDLSLENNPMVLSAKFDYEASKQEQQKAISGMLPKIDLFAKTTRQDSLSTTDNINRKGIGSRDGSVDKQVGVEISMPLYDGGVARSQRRSSITKSVSKKIAIEKARQAVSDQARQAWQNLQIAKNNLEYYKKQVKAQEVALVGTQKETEAGTKILLDVLNAQTGLLEAELKLIGAEKTLLLESYKILSALGLLNAVNLNLNVEKVDLISDYETVKARF